MYDFSTLSPMDFEHLVRDLLAKEHGWPLKMFAAGADGGVDLRCGTGTDKVVVQCKHYAGSTFSQLKSALVAEKPKMAVEKPGRYLVATSRELTKPQHDTLAADLAPLIATPDDVLHRSDLNALLLKWPDVEQNHFKLWLASSAVLARIVNSGLWARSEAMLEDIQSRVRLYVAHAGYQRARKILDANRVVVITGSPGVGKSMLADMLLLTHHREDWQVVQVGADIEEAWTAYRSEIKQIFLYDDFLGQTNAGESLTKNEDARIADFARLVAAKADKRFVLTTRTQVLNQARQSREPLARASFDLASCIVALADYSRLSRARIVYNHLYFSDLPREVIREYAASGAFWTAIDHPNFSPRTVEQVLLRPHADATALAGQLAAALDRPIDLWGPSFEHGLSDLARELLLTLVTFPPEGVLRTALEKGCAVSASSLQTNQAFKALEGTWIVLAGTGNGMKVRFADPSCRDYVLAFADSHPDEGLRLLLQSDDLNRALLLLRYASSRGQGRRALYPGLRSAYAERSGDVLARVGALYAERAKAAHDHGQLETALVSVLAAAPLLGKPGRRWLEEQVVALPAAQPAEQFHAVRPVAELIVFLAGRRGAADVSAKRRARLEGAIAALSLAIADEATTEDEFDAFAALCRHPDAGPLLAPAAGTAVARRVAEFVREDLSELTSVYSEPEDMNDRVSDLRTLAERHGVADALAFDFREADEAISERAQYAPEVEDLSPNDAGRAFESVRASGAARSVGDARAAEDREIVKLFRNLE